MPNIHATAGQVFVRKNADGTMLIGTFESKSVAPFVEGAAYVAMLTTGGLVIATTPLDAGIPKHLEGQGIAAAIYAPIWCRVTASGAIVIRAFQSFEGSNWWTFYGVSRARLPDEIEFDNGGHAWLRLDPGKATQIDAPLNAAGLAIGQLLGKPVWPGPDGRTYMLPQHTPRWCRRYFEMNLRLASAGGDPEQGVDILAGLRRDPRFAAIAPFRNEKTYLTYLAALNDAGVLQPDAPWTAEEAASRDVRRRGALESAQVNEAA